MRIRRIGLIALATVVLSAFHASPVTAAPWQLCLALDSATGSPEYFMNFNIQGNAILVSGMRGRHSPETHGPLVGALDRTPGPASPWELGVSVTIQNAGDYAGFNTENVVFEFETTGTIFYKRWLNGNQAFTQGSAFVRPCPTP